MDARLAMLSHQLHMKRELEKNPNAVMCDSDVVPFLRARLCGGNLCVSGRGGSPVMHLDLTGMYMDIMEHGAIEGMVHTEPAYTWAMDAAYNVDIRVEGEGGFHASMSFAQLQRSVCATLDEMLNNNV